MIGQLALSFGAATVTAAPPTPVREADPRELMAVFGAVTHHWTRAPGRSEATALCTGFGLRGRGAKLADRDPTCPGCRVKLGLPPLARAVYEPLEAELARQGFKGRFGGAR